MRRAGEPDQSNASCSASDGERSGDRVIGSSEAKRIAAFPLFSLPIVPMTRSPDDPISRSPDLPMTRSFLLSSLATRVSGGAFADRGLPRRRFRRWQFSFVHREHERIRGVIGKYSDDLGRGSRRRRPGQRLLHTHMEISFVCGLVFFRDGTVDGISRRGDDLDAGRPYFHLFATVVLLGVDRRLPHLLV